VSETAKVPAPVRRYVVVGADGREHLVKATSPAGAVQTIYETKVRVATGDDIERLLTAMRVLAK
jgi:hypothetical protein